MNDAVNIALENSIKKQIVKNIIVPYVNFKITDENVTKEQKAQLIIGATSLLQKVLNKNPATIFVIIDEVKTDNWGGRGRTSKRKKKTRKVSILHLHCE